MLVSWSGRTRCGGVWGSPQVVCLWQPLFHCHSPQKRCCAAVGHAGMLLCSRAASIDVQMALVSVAHAERGFCTLHNRPNQPSPGQRCGSRERAGIAAPPGSLVTEPEEEPNIAQRRPPAAFLEATPARAAALAQPRSPTFPRAAAPKNGQHHRVSPNAAAAPRRRRLTPPPRRRRRAHAVAATQIFCTMKLLALLAWPRPSSAAEGDRRHAASTRPA